MALEHLEFTPFGGDGDWAARLGVTDNPNIAPLRAIFSPEWVRAHRESGDFFSHPFIVDIHGWMNRTRTLELVGRTLISIGTPKQLASDLSDPSRYRSRTHEAWSSAFLQHLGFEIEYLDEQAEGKKCEFVAQVGSYRAAAEAKGPEPEVLRKRARDVHEVMMRGLLARAGHTTPELAPQRAEWLADLADRWGLEFNDRGGAQMSAPPPPGRAVAKQARKGVLAKAAEQVRQVGLPGIVLLDRLLPPWHWDSEALRALDDALQRSDASWTKEIAVLFARLALPDGGADSVVVLRGPRFDGLPEQVRTRLGGGRVLYAPLSDDTA